MKTKYKVVYIGFFVCLVLFLGRQLDLIVVWETGSVGLCVKYEELVKNLQKKTWILLNVLHIMLKQHPGKICEEKWTTIVKEKKSLFGHF